MKRDEDQAGLYEFLSEYVSEHKKQLFERVLADRTRHVTVALEDIYQPHNASAVLRSCDGMGIQDVHIIENYNRFSVNDGVTIGSEKWLDLHYHNQATGNTSACFRRLWEQGYQICVASPHQEDVAIDQLPLEQPMALVVGSELSGLSDYAMAHADRFVRIPMYGFIESFNLSVSAAICLYELRKRLRESDVAWQLSEEEKQQLRLQWTRASVKNADILERYYAGKVSDA